MGEKVNKGVYRTLQNLSSVWHPGEVGRTPLSADSDNNRRGGPPLDDPRNEYGVNQRNGASRPEKISFQNANYPGKQNYDDETVCVGSPYNSKCNSINERMEDREIYVRDISPQRNNDRSNNGRNAVPEQPINSNGENGEYSNIITTVPLSCCPNGERVFNLQRSLGYLCRVGTFIGNARTEEMQKTPCRFVVSTVQDKRQTFSETMSHVSMDEKKDETQKDCKIPKNPFLTVEMIVNKLDRKHAAESLGRYIENKNPDYKFYLEDIKAYGFDHIIIIGECYDGILFLDCYGRLFEWGDMMAVLWPLGDYWSVVSKRPSTRRVIWSVECDGTIAEFEDTIDNLPKPATKTMDVHPVAKKKKNSKKKNSKKKH